ncbi:MAG: glycosyltransferase family 2 protein [Oscillospiraceae bacterium]|nr:glycosyltransferase family 2 protein [Oscillospiraceae bacterium]
MKLQILIPHYHEGASVIRPLLDSIAIQQNVDFSEIGIIICHDGEDIPYFALSDYYYHPREDIIPFYQFKVEQIHIDHKGVSAARNCCLDYATAEYVMWCDVDDMLYNACGLWIIFREIEKGGFDGLRSLFIEETRHPKTGEVIYINRENDSTFVHGKVWRREYLIENKIRWNEDLTIHEDSYFNSLALNLSKNVKECPYPFYLWRWRDDSVCRHDPKYMIKTYRDFIKSNDALVDEYLRRGKNEEAANICAMMVLTSYYTMNKPEWTDQENQEYRYLTERRFGEYFRKHKGQWDSIDKRERMQMSAGVRNRSIMEGMEMEHETIDSWLKKVEAMK